MNLPKYCLGIALLGKGATNHLHRKEVVHAFVKQNIRIIFLVREDYMGLLTRIPGCEYQALNFLNFSGVRGKLLRLSRDIRMRYPSTDPGVRERFRRQHLDSSLFWKILNWLFCLLALSNPLIRLLTVFEGLLIGKHPILKGCNSEEIDQLLLLGVGSTSSDLEGLMTWWGRRHKISVIHIVGNYDILSSKGFRGIPIERLLVWGKNMREDAERIHFIPSNRITEIGPIRYNVNPALLMERDRFLEDLGLDPKRKTILFAGFIYESQYFEMLDCFLELQREGLDCQLIFRFYPNKKFMASVYLEPLLSYARNLEGVAVSLADPHYNAGDRGRSVLQIEEYQLWNSLASCDCVINIFSTIAIEACMFDKPTIYMWYFPVPTGNLARHPVYFDHASNFHNRRLASYGAIKTATSRTQLKNKIRQALTSPNEHIVERRKVVEDEIGQLDGRACERLVNACMIEYVGNNM